LAINSIQFDRFGNLIFMGSIPDVDLDRMEVSDIPEISTKPYKYTTATDQLAELSVLERHFGDILELYVTPDGNSAILHKYNYDMEVASLIDGESVTVGKYNVYGQFNYNGNSLGLLSVDYE